MSPKRSIPVAAWVFAAAFAVRLLVLVRFSASPGFLPAMGDMRFYSDWARRIAEGQLTDGRAFYGLPGYAYWLGALFALAGFDPFAAGLLQTASEAGIAALIYQIALWAFPGKSARGIGLLAAAGWTFFVPAQAFSVILMPTTWVVLSFWGIFLWSVRTESRSPWKPWLFIGVAAGGVATMVATIFFILPIAAAAAARNLRRPRLVLGAAASLLGGVILGTAPCWVHNYFIAKEPVFLSAHGGLNFWIGNNPEANGYPKLPPEIRRASQEGMLRDSLRVPEALTGRAMTRAEVSRFWSQKANAYIREHPGDWLKLMGLKVKAIWNAARYDDLSVIGGFEEEGITTPGLGFGWVAILALPGAALAWRRHPRSRWIAAAALLYMAALLPVFVTERYRLAAVPGLLLLAACGLAELFEALARRDGRRAAAWLGTGAAAYFWVTLPQPGLALPLLADYNAGIQALERGDLPRAKERLERAFAGAPQNAELHAALGNYWLKAGDSRKAREFYESALALNPETATALNNLAYLEIGDRRWEAARGLLERALALNPARAELYFMAAQCDERLGRPGQARAEIERAQALRPGNAEIEALRRKLAEEEPERPAAAPGPF